MTEQTAWLENLTTAAKRRANHLHAPTGWPTKLAQFLYTLTLRYQILTDFQNYFTVRIRRKSVIILSLKLPPHLKSVAILPCEMSVS